jgi:hypothetical protein
MKIMKKIWIVLMVFGLAGTTAAQTKGNKTVKKNITKKKAATARKINKTNNEVISLTSTGSYPAKTSTKTRYSVSDPFINILNARARGVEPDVKNVQLFGMPKGAYGFANGRLRVFPTGTTSSGTITGMGAVATGSSPGAIGSTGLGMGANGKSPYAGTAMWGNARGLLVTKGDSSLRRIRQ